MNGESTGLNGIHSWPFSQMPGFNGSLFSGGHPFHSGPTLPCNPQYLQLASALRWPFIFPRQNTSEVTSENHHQTISSPPTKTNFDSIPSSGLTKSTSSPESTFNYLSTSGEIPQPLPTSSANIFDEIQNENCKDSSSPKDFSNTNSQSPESDSSSCSHQNKNSKESPFLKFGVQAILSQVPPLIPSGKM